jgi:hypothetical protein
MNKYKFILGIAAVGLTMASCSDPLDAPNKSAMSEDIIFSTEVLADAAVMGIHQSFGEQNSYRARFIPYYGTNTDCEIFNNYAGVADPATDKEASLAVYSATVDNTYMNTDNNAWAKLYEGIERANKAIESMALYGGIDDESNINMRQLYGELLTLRGMIYFDLVKAWGDVPYRFSPINSETLYIKKTDRVTILKKVMDDLLEAEQYLGWPNENKYTVSVERVSKSFAKGLRARIALFLAGYSQWPTAEGDHMNSELRYNISDPAERQAMYQIARDECVSIINSGKNTLGSFEECFRTLCAENTAAGKESIFEIPFSDGRGRVLWTWGVKHKDADLWTKQPRGGVNGPTPTLWYDYDPQDVRRNITCIPYMWSAGAKTLGSTSGGGWSFGKLRYEWMNRIVTSTNDDGMNWQVMRYADIYMMAAEAENQLSGPSSAAQYIQPVMSRAYPAAKVSDLIAAASSQDAFQLLIENERKFEFAGEALRKIDLIRWGKLGSKLAETKQKMIALANRSGEYADYPEKVYYNDGLDAESTDADGYTIYGLEKGQTDAEGKTTYALNSRLFCYEGDATKENDQKINKYINNLYLNDPDTRMFWPIWRVFISSSNGSLVNDYGYGE